MFKKHKQLIIGFLLGALVFGIVPVGATVQNYLLKKSEVKLMVDGQEFADKDLPVLIYEGYNYLPAATFREISEKIGIGFEWVGEKNEIQIDTKKVKSIKEGKVDNMEQRETSGSSNRLNPSSRQGEITTTDNEHIILLDGVKHISSRGIIEFLWDYNKDRSISESYVLSPFRDGTKKIHMGSDDENIVVDNLPMKRLYGDQFHNYSEEFVEYDYFEKEIVPLIK